MHVNAITIESSACTLTPLAELVISLTSSLSLFAETMKIL